MCAGSTAFVKQLKIEYWKRDPHVSYILSGIIRLFQVRHLLKTLRCA
jgi:hypothetical protein